MTATALTPPASGGRFRSTIRRLQALSQSVLDPIGGLVTRLALGFVFIPAGLTKLRDFEGAKQLFEYEYETQLLFPFIPIPLMTGFAVFAELICASLVVAGLFTRLAALPLLGTALVIQFGLGVVLAKPAYFIQEHYLWMALALTVILRGPGALSLDRLLFGAPPRG